MMCHDLRKRDRSSSVVKSSVVKPLFLVSLIFLALFVPQGSYAQSSTDVPGVGPSPAGQNGPGVSTAPPSSDGAVATISPVGQAPIKSLKAVPQDRMQAYMKAKSKLNATFKDSFQKVPSSAGIYKNAGMGFSTLIPSDWKISEMGNHAMHATLSGKGEFLSFSASNSDIDERITLDMYYEASMKALPPGWVIKNQERTTLDGVAAIAIDAMETHGSVESYRQRIYLIRNKKLWTFDVVCPSNQVAKNNSMIRAIWSNLRFS